MKASLRSWPRPQLTDQLITLSLYLVNPALHKVFSCVFHFTFTRSNKENEGLGKFLNLTELQGAKGILAQGYSESKICFSLIFLILIPVNIQSYINFRCTT